MARKSQHSVNKRRRELRKAEKAQQKLAKRLQRNEPDPEPNPESEPELAETDSAGIDIPREDKEPAAD